MELDNIDDDSSGNNIKKKMILMTMTTRSKNQDAKRVYMLSFAKYYFYFKWWCHLMM